MWNLLSTALELSRPGRFPVAAVQTEPARAWWEVFLIVMGAVVTCAAFMGVVFKVARPHIDRYIRGLVSPMASQLDDVHSEVKPDHGESVKDQVGQLVHQVGRANRQLTSVDGRGRMVEGMLRQHLEESRNSLRALHAQGIVTDLDDSSGDHTEGKRP